ncbi:hypothetical protein PV327_011257 [Microctonus hyperodae]|uniref:Methyltransferase FkbM domain-containing protein n=1 Tax=Microctonus hyperodae TaxID=165561 RepID=A0AA39FL61_MICHY|nr:hypothetical protein PV327_011257 [Microctonus hyperodae]
MLGKKRRAYLSPACLSIKPRPMRASFLMARNIGRVHEPENFTNIGLSNSPDVAHHGTHIIVQCFPLLTYIAAFRFPIIDYLSLDVEGNEMDILETIPFNLVDIKTLSVEYTHTKKNRNYMMKFMEDYGYYVHSFINHPDNLANDIIFVKK